VIPDRTGPAAPPPRLRARVAAAIRAELAARVRTVRNGFAWLWSRRPRGRRGAAIGFAALLTLVGAWSVAWQAGLPSRLPGPAEWAALGTLLEGEARPGDAVVLAPAWAERARRVAPAGVPVLAVRSYADEDLWAVRRVWLVSLHDAPAFRWEIEKDLLQRANRNEAPLALGPMEVTRYDLGMPRLPFAFLPDLLSRAEVRLGDTRCPPDLEGVFRCPGPDGAPAATVARAVREVGGAPRPCLEVDGAGPVRVTFPPVRLGRSLRGHAGAPGDPATAAALHVRVAVQIDDDEGGEAEVQGAGWRPFAIDTSGHAGRAHAVVLTIAREGGPALPACVEAVAIP
jgi:hypothetical protein